MNIIKRIIWRHRIAKMVKNIGETENNLIINEKLFQELYPKLYRTRILIGTPVFKRFGKKGAIINPDNDCLYSSVYVFPKYSEVSK